MRISTERKVYLSLEKTAKVVRDKVNAYLRVNGKSITFIQWNCLSSIHQSPGISQKILAKSLHKEEASISRLVAKLRSKNLLIAKKSETDNKTVKLYLSPEGFETFEQHQVPIEKIYKSIFSGIYDRELNIVFDILNRVIG